MYTFFGMHWHCFVYKYQASHEMDIEIVCVHFCPVALSCRTVICLGYISKISSHRVRIPACALSLSTCRTEIHPNDLHNNWNLITGLTDFVPIYKTYVENKQDGIQRKE
jgi:hypothetical protein